jgi:hypothetical protein
LISLNAVTYYSFAAFRRKYNFAHNLDRQALSRVVAPEQFPVLLEQHEGMFGFHERQNGFRFVCINSDKLFPFGRCVRRFGAGFEWGRSLCREEGGEA